MLAVALLSACLCPALQAQRAPLPGDAGPAALPYLDVRLDDGLVTAAVRQALDAARSVEQRAAREAELSELGDHVLELRLDDDEFFGTPHFLRSTRQLLTEAPAGRWSPLGVVSDFVGRWPALMEVEPSELALARVARNIVTRHNGVTHLTLQQQIGGVDLWGCELKASVSAAGELITISSTLLPRPDGGFDAPAAVLSDRDAIVLAGADVGIALEGRRLHPLAAPLGAEALVTWQTPAGLRADTPLTTQLVWFPRTRATIHPAWAVVVAEPGIGNTYEITVDALDGTILRRENRLRFATANEPSTFNVFPLDSPAPGSPGTDTPNGFQFPLVPRQLITITGPISGSPDGWIPDGANETLGNNVDAHTDLDANNQPDLPRPHGTPYRVFNFPLDLNQGPGTYRQAAVTQLFYYCNLIHDKLYDFGFDEPASNFQLDNFGLGGVGDDRVLADAQDGSGTNNANWSGNGSDGTPTRIQMFIFTGPAPNRDGDLDGDVVYHEYVHGLSTRLSGGTVSGQQSGGMGEGWGDFFGVCMNAESGDDPDAVYPMGGYITKDFIGMQDNYYFGIRRYPYSADMTKSPLTYADADPAQFVVPAGIPNNSIFIGNPANEVHNVGELWCQVLLECRSALWNGGLGFAANDLIMQLVVDGMKLMPSNPNFLEARDGILAADLAGFGGSHLTQLWQGFAKRGMGNSASSPSGNSTNGIVEAFDVPALMLFAYPSGQPSQLLPNLPASFAVTVSALGGIQPIDGSGQLHYSVDGGPTISVPMSSTGTNQYLATLPPLPCSSSVAYWVSSNSTSGVLNDPPGAPGSGSFAADVYTSISVVFSDDFELSGGWQAGAPGDTAIRGLWVQGDPLGTHAQPANDHTNPGTDCFFTGQGTPGGGLNEEDVDSGSTTLLSPLFDLSAGDARVGYWRWYSNATGSSPNADVLQVDISNDGGASWAGAETVGPSGPDTAGGWIYHEFTVSDVVAPSATMQLRFVATDDGPDSVIEAALDDVSIFRLACTEGCQTDLGLGGPGDLALSVCGAPLVTGAANALTVSGANPGGAVFLALGLAANPTPFKGGLLVPMPVLATVAGSADGSGTFSLTVLGGGGPVSVIVQALAPDVSQPAGFELSNAVDVAFLP